MNDNLDQAVVGHPPPPYLRSSRRRWPWLLLVALLAVSGGGIAYAWPEIAPLIPSVGRETPAEQFAASDKDALPELLASQQKIEEDLATLTKSVADQQEQVKLVVDQLAALTSKVAALQPPAPTPAPAAAPAQATVEQPPIPLALATPKAKKPPRRPAVRSSGPVSVGGAPLNGTPSGTAN
jgi:uncharacterized coiled-coil protein SlyX